MRYDLRAMTLRARNPRRPQITFRDIRPPATLATDLYQSGYSDVIAIWSAAAERIVAEYERTLSTMVTDSPADLQAQLDAAEAEVQRLFLVLTPRLRSWLFRVEGFVRGRWRGAVLTATGVDISTLVGPEDARETLEIVLERNVALVKDVSAQARGRISDAVFRGLTERQPAREVAKEVRNAVGMARDRSIRIASHQLGSLSETLAEERRRESGLDSWAWVASHKRNFRPEHQARDGKVYTDATAPKDLPRRLPGCGCTSRAVMVFE
ncbi:phage minor head protein [Sphingomonas sp. PB4P5]|uniref:phage minor head protein n=1 Tax=Parasphingomonas puruogangriensis TaxID=3096155 RepID=UPI002FCB9ABC